MLSLAALVYVAFFVELGEHSLYGHLSRIADTSEARELGDEVGAAVGRVQEQVTSRVGNPAAPDAPANGP
jgi:hypothetical protein